MRSYLIFTTIVVLSWLTLIYTIGISSIPFNPMSFSRTTGFRAKLLLPEAWNFFTRDPREERVYIYRIDHNGSALPIAEWPNNNLHNFFGIKRTARAIGTDYGMILSKIADSLWLQSDEKDLRKNAAAYKSFSPHFTAFYPDDINRAKHFLYGNFLFIRKQIKPWSWYRLNVASDAPLKYIYGSIEKPE